MTVYMIENQRVAIGVHCWPTTAPSSGAPLASMAPHVPSSGEPVAGGGSQCRRALPAVVYCSVSAGAAGASTATTSYVMASSPNRLLAVHVKLPEDCSFTSASKCWQMFL